MLKAPTVPVPLTVPAAATLMELAVTSPVTARTPLLTCVLPL